MTARTFGPRRCRVGKKPDVQCPEPEFYRCRECGTVWTPLVPEKPVAAPSCCGAEMERIEPFPMEKLPEEIGLDYKITGGPNESAVQVLWSRTAPLQPRWLYLRTFTGGYYKRMAEQKRPPAVFPLADEDAYVYCDKDPCEECTFRCKRGFVLYAWFEEKGLARLPLERMFVTQRAPAGHRSETP